MNIDVEISKLVSIAFNKSLEWEEFMLNLDMLNISLEDAQLAWSRYNKIIIEHSSMKECCSNGIIDFKEAFEIKKISRGNRGYLPYQTKKDIDKSTYVPAIEMKIVSNDGNTRHISFSIALVKEMQTMHRIDIFKEMIDTTLGNIGAIFYGKSI